MSVNDWKMQEEIANESRRIIDSNIYDGSLKSEKKIKKDEKDESLHRENIAIVPLALPLLAGPGSISTIVVQSTNSSSFLKLILLCAAICLVMWASYLVLRSSQYLFRFMGKTGISLLERLMGIIVAAIAIQFILTGVGDSFPTLVALATSTLK